MTVEYIKMWMSNLSCRTGLARTGNRPLSMRCRGEGTLRRGPSAESFKCRIETSD